MHYVFLYVPGLCCIMHSWLWSCSSLCLYLVHAYAYAMSHPNLYYRLHSLSQHHLASTLTQSDPAVYVFSYFSWTFTDGIYGGLTITSGPRWSFRALCLLVVPHVMLCYAYALMWFYVYMLMWKNMAHVVLSPCYVCLCACHS